jgi:hypothetical protein
VHKDTIAIALAASDKRREVRDYGKIANTPAALRVAAAKLARGGSNLRFCYEAATGSSGNVRLNGTAYCHKRLCGTCLANSIHAFSMGYGLQKTCAERADICDMFRITQWPLFDIQLTVFQSIDITIRKFL